MKDRANRFNGSEKCSRECPSCGNPVKDVRLVDSTFVYGKGPKAQNISVRIPVSRCEVCEMEFTDESAEVLKHAAVCKHLGVMTPAEILDLRRRYGLSRGDFARITKLGEASLARWENGNLIQSQAYDQYLSLLKDPGNFERLRASDARENGTPASELSATIEDHESKFEALLSSGNFTRKKAAAESFELRRAS